MASTPVFYDRVKESSSTAGTGAYTLAGAASGFQTFAIVGNGNSCYYCATDGAGWEVGLGTYTSAGTTLSRDRILASSNSNNAVNWAAGNRDVFLVAPAENIAKDDAVTEIAQHRMCGGL